MGLVLVTPPLIEPVTLDDSKAHCRVVDDTEDELISTYTVGARQMLEARRYPGIGCSLITQTWSLTLDAFPPAGEAIELPMSPVQSITSITTVDTAGNSAVVSPSLYFLDKTADIPQKARIVAAAGGTTTASWPPTSLRSANGVIILYVTGFGDTPDKVPQGLRIAQLMLIGTMYMYREATGMPSPMVVPFGYDALTAPYRAAGIA